MGTSSGFAANPFFFQTLKMDSKCKACYNYLHIPHTRWYPWQRCVKCLTVNYAFVTETFTWKHIWRMTHFREHQASDSVDLFCGERNQINSDYSDFCWLPWRRQHPAVRQHWALEIFPSLMLCVCLVEDETSPCVTSPQPNTISWMFLELLTKLKMYMQNGEHRD